MGASLARGQAVGLLVGRRHLHPAVRERRSEAPHAGDHRRTKGWVRVSDGLRESTESWLDVLRVLKERGLVGGPRLAVGDGAPGSWKALDPEKVAALFAGACYY